MRKTISKSSKFLKRFGALIAMIAGIIAANPVGHDFLKGKFGDTTASGIILLCVVLAATSRDIFTIMEPDDDAELGDSGTGTTQS